MASSLILVAYPQFLLLGTLVFFLVFELELELIQTQMTQKPMLRAEVYALRCAQVKIVKRIVFRGQEAQYFHPLLELKLVFLLVFKREMHRDELRRCLSAVGVEVLCFLPSTHYPLYDFDLRATHARTLLPAALASVPFGFVLFQVRDRVGTLVLLANFTGFKPSLPRCDNILSTKTTCRVPYD